MTSSKQENTVLNTEMLTSILESIASPAAFAQQNRIIQINRAALDYLGMAGPQFEGTSVLRLIHPESRSIAYHAYRNLVEQPEQSQLITLRLQPLHQPLLYAQLQIRAAPYAGDDIVLIIAQDVTEADIDALFDYPTLIETLPIGIYRTSITGQILFANQAFARILGYESIEEVKQHKMSDFYADPDQRATNAERNEQIKASFYSDEFRWKRKDGSTLWIHSAGRIIRDATGAVRYYQGSLEDFTEKRQQEVRLQQRNQELEALQTIALELGSSVGLDATLNAILKHIQPLVPYDRATLFLFDNDKPRLIAGDGIASDLEIALSNKADELPLLRELTGEGAREETIIIPDTLKDPRYLIIEEEVIVRSYLGVALRYRDKSIGVLNLTHKQPNFYHDGHRRQIVGIANQAAIAIASAQLYDQAQSEIKRREEVQDILVQNLVNTETLYWVLRYLFEAESTGDIIPNLLHMMGAAMEETMLFLVVFDPESGQLRHKVKTENVPDEYDMWADFRQMVQEPDLPEDTMPSADLRWPEGHIMELGDGRTALVTVVAQRGILSAIRAESNAAPFHESDIELMVTVANQLSISLENERLYDQLQLRSDELEVLVEQRTAQLVMEQKRRQAILDGTAEGIFYMENFLIQYANPAFCRMVGYSETQLAGRPFSFLRVDDEGDQQKFTDEMAKKYDLEPGRNETRLRHRDGTEFFARIRFSVIGDANDNPLRMVAIARDISQERELYFQRARFIANAAHELRTPISSLMLRLHMMRRQPQKAIHHLDSLDSVSNYLKDLVEELLDLSRFERGTIELVKNTFVLQELIKQAVDTNQPFADEHNIGLELIAPEQPIVLSCDGTRIVQMLGNLIINGVNYNEGDGCVVIRAKEKTLSDGKEVASITIEDDGIGIEPHLLPNQIFEPFVRPSQGTRKETGMGLALCREIVMLHGGTIEAQSIKDAGSIFQIRLPLE